MEWLKEWQTLIGAFIGASSAFILWWVTDFFRKRTQYYDDLYFLERVLVDQINSIIDTERIIKHFIENKLNELIKNIDENDINSFSIDYTTFPLFSITPITEQIHRINTRSVYIDNKMAKSHQLSKDFPHIIDDLKEQLYSTVQLNRDLALNKINPPEIQKKGYVRNIEEYKKMLENDIIKNNLPILLKVFIQTREAINELRKIKLFRWQHKFELKYNFFFTRRQYAEAKKNIYEKTEAFFEASVIKVLEDIERKK